MSDAETRPEAEVRSESIFKGKVIKGEQVMKISAERVGGSGAGKNGGNFFFVCFHF